MGPPSLSASAVTRLGERYGDPSRVPILKDIEARKKKQAEQAGKSSSDAASTAEAGGKDPASVSPATHASAAARVEQMPLPATTPSGKPSPAAVAPPASVAAATATEVAKPAAAAGGALPAGPAPATAHVPEKAAAAAAAVAATSPPTPPPAGSNPPPASGPKAAAPAKPVAAPTFTPAEVSQLGEPVPFSQYGEGHERALAYMRWRRDDAVQKSGGALTPSMEMASDSRLWRFLVAKNFDCPAAADMYIGAMQWRKDAGIDAIRDQLVAANPGFFGGGADGLQRIYLSVEDRGVNDIYPRTFARETAEGNWELPLDRSGNLVYIECPGLVNMSEVYELGAEAYTPALLRSQELLQLVIDELSRRHGRLVLTLRILDMTGIQLVKLFQPKADKEGERIVKEAGKPLADAYPTTTYKNFLINLPAAGAAGPLVKAFAPARSAKKMVLLGGSFQTELHKEVDPSSLPSKLGGVLDDEGQWEKKKKKK
jgi:hypothetical protein